MLAQSNQIKCKSPKKDDFFFKKSSGKKTTSKKGKNRTKPRFWSGEKSAFLDTLAQLTTTFDIRPVQVADFQQLERISRGGQKTINLAPLAASKYMTIKFCSMLQYYNPESELRRAYSNSIHCCDCYTVNTKNNLISKHCKNRWCLKCNRIRTAVLRIGYLPQFRNMDDPQFVTLTARTVKGEKLPERIKFFEECWRKIMKYKVQHGKRLGISLVGLRKAECTPRPNDEYHYHFHLVLDGERNANWLVEQWLRMMGDKAVSGAQYVKKADENSLAELFKYFTKISSKMTGKDGYLGAPQQLDHIFTCVRGKRVFQPFGGLKMVSEDMTEEHVPYQLPDRLEGREYWWAGEDWVSEYGELLTKFEPTEQQKKSFTYS